jgi:adenine-specific DNA-methyltransferase
MMEINKIYCGDCMDLLKIIPDSTVDLIIADPPYNIGKDFGNNKDNNPNYINWSYKWINECMRLLKNSGTFYLMGATQFIPHFDCYISSKYNIISRIVWVYDSSGIQAKNYFGSLYEPILMIVKDKKKFKFNKNKVLVEAKTGSKRRLIDYRKSPPKKYNSYKVLGNVWHIPRIRYKMPEYVNHPTQKPLLLFKIMIQASSDENDIVLDPFLGSGTTAVACKQLNRKFIGIEINPEYVNIANKRINFTTVGDFTLTPSQSSGNLIIANSN